MHFQNALWILVVIIMLAFILIPILLSGNETTKLKVLAERKNWTIQPHPKEQRDFLFRGQEDDIRWQMEYYWIGAKKINTYRRTTPVVVWKTQDANLSDDALAIYALPARIKRFTPPTNPEGDKWDQSVHNTELEKVEQRFSVLSEHNFGVPELDKHYTLRATTLGLLQLEKSTVTEHLLTWPDKIRQMGGPVILADTTGITIWWIAFGVKPDWLERTAALGISLVLALKQ